jgi:ribosome-associated protein
MRDVIITKEPVELFKILKFEGLADSGGEAKAVVEQGLVKVNHVVETRKRKQIVAGDLIEFAGETLKISFGNKQIESQPAKAGVKKKRARLPGRALHSKQQ